MLSKRILLYHERPYLCAVLAVNIFLHTDGRGITVASTELRVVKLFNLVTNDT